MASEARARRDVIAIGTSAGGVEALASLLLQLPTDLPAAVLIVMHVPRSPPSVLVDILRRSSALPVKWAEQDDEVHDGMVYVAQPDLHMLVHAGRIVLVGGPKENHARPSINRLFRAVAAGYGSRAIGVILTGMLDDGVAGMISLRLAGGTLVVQDPGEAAYAEMPRNAVSAVKPDHVVAVRAMGALLRELTAVPVSTIEVPQRIADEARLDRARSETADDLSRLGEATLVSCPACGGRLWQVASDGPPSFRCYEGHAMSASSLLAMQSDELEHALWAAVRSLQERVFTLNTLGEDARRLGHAQSAAEYESRARASQDQVDRARAFLLDLQAQNARRATD